MVEKTTLSVIKADVGSVPGHVVAPPELLEECETILNKGLSENTINDFYITRCGDDIQLIMTHFNGEDNKDVHKLAYDAFVSATNKAKEMKLYGAGQDLL
ncbi:MAG: fructose 1,6-bisphosphatase, partial [archaeon]|nr:fructose 1,6-bisphosphatase [archaeon]